MNTIADLAQFSTVWTIWLGLLGQTIFCAIYATRPWRKFRITRAYFNKSMAMEAILLRSALLLAARGGYTGADDPLWVSLSSLVLNLYVLWAIWYQLYALILEIVYGDLDDPLGDNRDSRNRESDDPMGDNPTTRGSTP